MKNLLINGGALFCVAILFFAFHSARSIGAQESVRCDVNGLCTEVEQLRNDVAQLKNAVAQLNTGVSQLELDVAQLKKSELKFDSSIDFNPDPVGSNSAILRDYSNAREVEAVFVATNTGLFVVNNRQGAYFDRGTSGARCSGSFVLTAKKLLYNWTMSGYCGTIVKVSNLTAIYR